MLLPGILKINILHYIGISVSMFCSLQPGTLTRYLFCRCNRSVDKIVSIHSQSWSYLLENLSTSLKIAQHLIYLLRMCFRLSASTFKNQKILFSSLFWSKFPSKNCEISFKFPLNNLIKLRWLYSPKRQKWPFLNKAIMLMFSFITNLKSKHNYITLFLYR